jgi:hypothetical protein
METTVSTIDVILYAIATLLPLLFWLNRPLSSREFRGAKSERLRQNCFGDGLSGATYGGVLVGLFFWGHVGLGAGTVCCICVVFI